MERVYRFQKPNSEEVEVEIDDDATWDDVLEGLYQHPDILLQPPPAGQFYALAVTHSGRNKVLTQDEAEGQQKTFRQFGIQEGSIIKAVTVVGGA